MSTDGLATGRAGVGAKGSRRSRARRVRRPALAAAALAVVALAGLVFGIASGFGANRSTPYRSVVVEAADPQPTGRWGERLVKSRDIDRDRVNDFYVAAPSHTLDGVNNAGLVYLTSGRTRRVLRRIPSPEPQANANFGFYVSVLGDVDGDRRDDVAIGTDAQDVNGATGASCTAGQPGCNVDQGKAWVFSGRTGQVLYALNNPHPQGTARNSARFGSRIGRAGDVTRDRRADVIVGASNNDRPAGCANAFAPTVTQANPGGNPALLPAGCRFNEGEAFIFNGRTGQLVRTLNMPDEDRQPATCPGACGSLGLAVQGPGDTNRDRVVDQLVDAGGFNGHGRMYLFDGRTGRVRLKIDPPDPQPRETFGFQDAAPLSPGDVNGDGRADLYANGFAYDVPGHPGESEGRAWVFSGRNGRLLYAVNDPTIHNGGQFGWSVARTNYNRDRTPDLYVGQSPHHAGGVQAGGTYVFDGRNGRVLKRLERPELYAQPGGSFANLGPNLGWGLAALGDVNRDGEPDYAGGAPFTDVGASQDQGRVYVFLSRARAAQRPRRSPRFAG